MIVVSKYTQKIVLGALNAGCVHPQDIYRFQNKANVKPKYTRTIDIIQLVTLQFTGLSDEPQWGLM